MECWQGWAFECRRCYFLLGGHCSGNGHDHDESSFESHVAFRSKALTRDFGNLTSEWLGFSKKCGLSRCDEIQCHLDLTWLGGCDVKWRIKLHQWFPKVPCCFDRY